MKNTLLKITTAGLLLFTASSCTKSKQLSEPPAPAPIPSVTICSQTWMAGNLDVVTFRNGDTIPQVSGDAWGDMAIQSPRPAWCYLADDPANGAVYGKLYNWAAVTDSRGLAPAGWHVATYTEWTKLVDSCLGGTEVAGKEMKEAGYAHWIDPQLTAYYPTNSSGLTCLPGGYRASTVFINPPGYTGNWWCGTGDPNGHPYMIWLYCNDNAAHFSPVGNDGVSVRCVKDE